MLKTLEITEKFPMLQAMPSTKQLTKMIIWNSFAWGIFSMIGSSWYTLTNFLSAASNFAVVSSGPALGSGVGTSSSLAIFVMM